MLQIDSEQRQQSLGDWKRQQSLQQAEQQGRHASEAWLLEAKTAVETRLAGAAEQAHAEAQALQRMSAAVMHTVEHSAQERLLTAAVMQRFGEWGKHRSIGDWPAELIFHGPLRGIHDALRASRTRSLTLGWLLYAIKERCGEGAGSRQLDMLNLKAYIRCFPETFHMRSGRTADGRVSDLVLLVYDGAPADCLGDDAEDMGQHALAQQQAHQQAQQRAQQQGPQHHALLHWHPRW